MTKAYGTEVELRSIPGPHLVFSTIVEYYSDILTFEQCV
jgi:hypothetical protein